MRFEPKPQPLFRSGDRVPADKLFCESRPKTQATVMCIQNGRLYAVQLPSGELYRWFAPFELLPITPTFNNYLWEGDYATVQTEEGHPSHIKKGMTVKVVQAIKSTPFYDVRLPDGSYRRWIAEFEITASA